MFLRRDQTGVFHFHSSTMPGATSRISWRSRAITLPRQSASSSMYWVIRSAEFVGTERPLRAGGRSSVAITLVAFVAHLNDNSSDGFCLVQKRQLLFRTNDLCRRLSDEMLE